SDLNNVYDCLDFLKWYFEGGTDKDGIPAEVLESRKYHELLEVRGMYFMMTRELMSEYMDEMRRSAERPAAPPAPDRASPPMAGGSRAMPPLPAPAIAAEMSPRTPPPLPQRHTHSAVPGSGGAARPTSGHGDCGGNSSTDSLTIPPTQDVRTAIVPTLHAKSTLSRNRSVWAHKDANTLRRFRRSHRMATDKGDLILRILRLRFDKEAARFVQTQLDLRAQQMQYEMRRAAMRRP
ncbi:hypothetical protein IWQ57_000738, partial [Coemansia nantahalensis]